MTRVIKYNGSSIHYLAEAKVADVVGAGALTLLHADLAAVAEPVAAVGVDDAALVHLLPT